MNKTHFRHSIRFKLFVVFALIVASLQLVFWLFSTNVLQSVLIYGNEMEMIQMVSRYQSALKEDPALGSGENSDVLLAQLSYEWDGNLTLIDKDKGEYKTTVPLRGAPGGMMDRTRMIADIYKRHENLAVGQVRTQLRQDRNGKDSLAIFVGRVSDNQLLISEKPLNVIRESSKLVSRFLMISGFLTVLIGSLAILLLSKKLTQPIIEIEEQAKRIAELDFDKQNEVSQSDEIGSLGRAVNQIAAKLSHTIGALNEANDKLKDEIENERRIERMRRQFVSNVSHELKTPISMIVGYADGLKFGIAKNPDNVEKYCDIILSESEKMNTLINDLLDMSAYQEGHLPIQQKRFNLSETILKAGETFSAKAREQQTPVIYHLEDSLEILGDQFRIEQVLRNLLSNALKHVSNEGGVVVQLRSEGHEAVLSVYNDGDAIPEDELEAIWMSFYRGGQAREKQMDGFGIGLALVREIVEKHSGRATCSNVENGVKFEVWLPMNS